MSRITIERLAAGGDGVGRLPDGLTVFVPRTAPADQVDVDLVERRPRFARGVAGTVHVAGPDRAVPPCPHYVGDRCGGCQLQHLTLDAQLQAKRSIVGDALRRIGKRIVADPPIISSPDPWRYRAKITLQAKGVRIGLHRFDHPADVFMLDDCHITRVSLMELWTKVRRAKDLLPPGLDTLVLRESVGGERHVVAESPDAWDAAPLATAVGDAGVSYWWKPLTGAARVVHGPATGFPAMAFEQNNPAFAAQIRQAAVDGLGDIAGKTVWDLYGGVGDTARLLSQRGALVWSVDSDPAAIDWAREQGGSNITYVAERCEEALQRLPTPDACVVNPPRTGMHQRVAAGLERWASEARRAERPAAASYVSCDPATLARDLSRMPSLNLVSATAYDLFPQTSHVETLAVLKAT